MNHANKMNGLFLRVLSKKLSILKSTTNDVKYLGRWSIENSYTTINQKVDYANEDHCGVCSNGVKQNRNKDEYEDIDEYIRYMM